MGKEDGYDSDKHFKEIMGFVEGVIDETLIDEGVSWRGLVGEGIQAMIDGEMMNEKAIRELYKDICETERAGVVAFRY